MGDRTGVGSTRARALLWLDAGAACAAGLMVLALREWLMRLLAFRSELILFVAIANLLYASYSGLLAAFASKRKMPTRVAIDVLIVANLAWVLVCAAIVFSNWHSANAAGLALVAFEGVFVGSLAVCEYRFVRPFAAADRNS